MRLLLADEPVVVAPVPAVLSSGKPNRTDRFVCSQRRKSPLDVTFNLAVASLELEIHPLASPDTTFQLCIHEPSPELFVCTPLCPTKMSRMITFDI